MTDPVSEDARYVVIVQQGQAELFLSLKDRLEAPDLAQVIWDRRAGQRRREPGAVGDDRRSGDRRSTDLLGRVVALLVASPAARGPAGSRLAS
jgi:hypothetical protein